MNFRIENTSSSDLDEILELNQQALPAVSSVTKEEMHHFLRKFSIWQFLFIFPLIWLYGSLGALVDVRLM